MIWRSSTIGLCSKTRIWSPPPKKSPHLNDSKETKKKLRFWGGLDNVLNPIQMLLQRPKRAVHAWKPFNVVESKQFCKGEFFPPQWYERLISSYRKYLVADVAVSLGENNFFTSDMLRSLFTSIDNLTVLRFLMFRVSYYMYEDLKRFSVTNMQK